MSSELDLTLSPAAREQRVRRLLEGPDQGLAARALGTSVGVSDCVCSLPRKGRAIAFGEKRLLHLSP